MRNAEFRVDGGFPTLPGEGARVGANGVNGTGGGFGESLDSLSRELTREVTRYIEQGDRTSDGATALNAEGAWRRQQAGAVPAASSEAGGISEAERQAFVDRMLPLARDAASRLGVAPEVLTAQAALETGWGRSPVRAADGADAHNLFGIKAGAGWRGASAAAATTEFEDGAPVARVERFRTYASPAASFDDLAALVGGSARYQGALNTGADARAYGAALQAGGYATDPAYADKLARVAARIQGTTR